MYSADLPRTEVFGRYRILGLIGQGGMARLHIAEQSGIEGFSKIVALKRVHPHLADVADLRRMFSTEAKLAARLDHPNIAAVQELGEVDGTYFISMEYLPGEDLAAILRHTGPRTPMPLELALWIGENAAAALHYAHELVDASGRPVGMVHRDVTPSNIMVTYHGVVKLLDFGIAKSRTSEVSTREGVFKGKLSYSAPEQLGGGDAVDRRADVFCLGIVLWECLTGRRLFQAPTDAGRIDAVRSREILPPSAHRPEIPVELDAVIMRMLVRDRDQRYATALDVQQVLGAMLTWQLDRVTPDSAAAWLEKTFGTERAAVKRAIAQGHNVHAMVQALARMQAVESATDEVSSSTPISSSPRSVVKAGPRKAWSTGAAGGASVKPTPATSAGSGAHSGSFTPPPPVSGSAFPAPLPPPPSPAPVTADVAGSTRDVLLLVDADASSSRTWGPLAAVLALLVGAVIAGTVVVMEGDGGAPGASATATGTLRVTSDPPGAQVFVDGNPTGQLTPATLHRLPLERPLLVRVVRPGLAPGEREVKLGRAEASLEVQFHLAAAVGLVRFSRLPARAQVYVDERRIEAGGPLELEVGRHQIRVESEDDVLWSSTIEVRAGQQTIEVPTR